MAFLGDRVQTETAEGFSNLNRFLQTKRSVWKIKSQEKNKARGYPPAGEEKRDPRLR
jgi:hypothetical protein